MVKNKQITEEISCVLKVKVVVTLLLTSEKSKNHRIPTIYLIQITVSRFGMISETMNLFTVKPMIYLV